MNRCKPHYLSRENGPNRGCLVSPGFGMRRVNLLRPIYTTSHYVKYPYRKLDEMAHINGRFEVIF